MWKICVPFLIALMIVGVASGQQNRTDTLVFHFTFDQSKMRPGDSKRIAHYFGERQRAFNTGGIDRGYWFDSVLVAGYTDTVGSKAYNQRLSQRRAEAVVAYVIQWLPQETPRAGRLEARGETDPLPGDDSLSRRVLVIVHYRLRDTPVVATVPPPPHPEGEPDTVIPLENIRFIANTPILTDEARELMPRITPQLLKFSDRYLEINGYCNAPGPPLPEYDPLFKLSVARAKYIYDYLIGQGFDSTHLRYIGRGNASPLNANPVTKQEMDQNMRVEIRVFRQFPPR